MSDELRTSRTESPIFTHSWIPAFLRMMTDQLQLESARRPGQTSGNGERDRDRKGEEVSEGREGEGTNRDGWKEAESETDRR